MTILSTRRYKVTVNGTAYTFDLQELAEEAKREYQMRREVYPKLVRNGRLTWDEAERRIASMKAIWKYLERQCELEAAGQASLFEEVNP